MCALSASAQASICQDGIGDFRPSWAATNPMICHVVRSCQRCCCWFIPIPTSRLRGPPHTLSVQSLPPMAVKQYLPPCDASPSPKCPVPAQPARLFGRCTPPQALSQCLSSPFCVFPFCLHFCALRWGFLSIKKGGVLLSSCAILLGSP